jgi:hypothetical protein
VNAESWKERKTGLRDRKNKLKNYGNPERGKE